MNGIELKFYRDLIGLPVSWCARQLGVIDRAWQAQETNERDVPDHYEDLILKLMDDSYAHMNAVLSLASDGVVTAYDNEYEFWDAFGTLKGMPISFHRSAVARGIEMLRLQKDRELRIVRHTRSTAREQPPRVKPDLTAMVRGALPDGPNSL